VVVAAGSGTVTSGRCGTGAAAVAHRTRAGGSVPAGRRALLVSLGGCATGPRCGERGGVCGDRGFERCGARVQLGGDRDGRPDEHGGQGGGEGERQQGFAPTGAAATPSRRRGGRGVWA
jgi:hypothetical protein